MSLITEILDEGAEAFIRASLTAYFNDEVQKGTIDATKAAYIEEGAADAVGFGLKQWQAQKK